MGEVDQAWLRLGAAESLQVNGWLGLPEREHQVPFAFCASRLRLLVLPGVSRSQPLQSLQQFISFLGASIFHPAKEPCHLLELNLGLSHITPWDPSWIWWPGLLAVNEGTALEGGRMPKMEIPRVLAAWSSKAWLIPALSGVKPSWINLNEIKYSG